VDDRELFSTCRHLHGTGPRKPFELLEAAAAWCREHDVDYDVYGTGRVIEDLEARVAALLGFEAARFLPSGTMAQQIALRVHADRARLPHVGMHPTSHVDLHEERGYAHLHGLRATLVGPRDTPLLAQHLEAVREPLAALLIELPIREAGGQLPSWGELEALKAAASARGVPLHLDGARLWECGPAYERTYDEICRGFSSAYVSFYKGIGALSGAMLLGDADFVAEATVWQRRHGGNLWSLVPNVVTATMLLEERLARMPRWLAHARRLARALADVPGVRVLPDPPHTNLFHLWLDDAPSELVAARRRVAASHRIWTFGGLRPGPLPSTSITEVYVADAALEIAPEELAAAFRALMSDPSTARPPA
jgi:threonine aldolase